MMRASLEIVGRRKLCLSFVLGFVCLANIAHAEFSTAQIWDEQLLHAISIDTARPTVHARNLFHLSTAMYDAWAAYDPVANQYLHHEKLSAPNLEAARNEAISYAAYNLIKERFVTGPAALGPGKAETHLDLDFQMTSLGYDPNFTSTIGNSPAALGNRIAKSVINYGLVRRLQRAQQLCDTGWPVSYRLINR